MQFITICLLVLEHPYLLIEGLFFVLQSLRNYAIQQAQERAVSLHSQLCGFAFGLFTSYFPQVSQDQHVSVPATPLASVLGPGVPAPSANESGTTAFAAPLSPQSFSASNVSPLPSL